MYNKHYPSILVTFFGETAHFSGKIEALRWSILVGKQKSLFVTSDLRGLYVKFLLVGGMGRIHTRVDRV